MLAFLLVGFGVLGGCSRKREVTGQVFVVTKGGENVKLGLVGIHVVGEERLMEIGSKSPSENSFILRDHASLRSMIRIIAM